MVGYFDEYAYLAKQIVMPACGDHPAFLMGRRGERVKLHKRVVEDTIVWYHVEGPTNTPKRWWVRSEELMRTKPWG